MSSSPSFTPQHEANYQVKWPTATPLDPRIFAEYFDDFPHYFDRYKLKEKEYLTPIKARLYCCSSLLLGGRCSAFLGERATPPDLVDCSKCGKSVCGQCGSGEEYNACEAIAEDSLASLGGLKSCPNRDCKSMLTLRDGCNDVRCNMCQTRFCWICKKLNPEHQH